MEHVGTCPVCLGDGNTLRKMRNCQHGFCEPCLRRFITTTKPVLNGSLCPVCRVPMSDADIVGVLGEEGLVLFRQQQQLNPPSADVEALVVEDAASLAAFRRALRKRHIKFCPACGVTIEKNGGCSHMTCRCGHNFEWETARTAVPCHQLHVKRSLDIRQMYGRVCPDHTPLAVLKLVVWRIFVTVFILPFLLVFKLFKLENMLLPVCLLLECLLCGRDLVFCCARSTFYFIASCGPAIDYCLHKHKYPYGPETVARTQKINAEFCHDENGMPTIVLTGHEIGCVHLVTKLLDEAALTTLPWKSVHTTLAKLALSGCMQLGVIPHNPLVSKSNNELQQADHEEIKRLLALETVQQFVKDGCISRLRTEDPINALLVEFLVQCDNTASFTFQGEPLTRLQVTLLLVFRVFRYWAGETRAAARPCRLVFVGSDSKLARRTFADARLVAGVCNTPAFSEAEDPVQLRVRVENHLALLGLVENAALFSVWWCDQARGNFNPTVFNQTFPDLQIPQDDHELIAVLTEPLSAQTRDTRAFHLGKMDRVTCDHVSAIIFDNVCPRVCTGHVF